MIAAAFLMPILPAPTFAAQPAPEAEIFPPWQHGKNNDATNRGFEFTVPQVDDLADFHGDITDPKLLLYVGGNYFTETQIARVFVVRFTGMSLQGESAIETAAMAKY